MKKLLLTICLLLVGGCEAMITDVINKWDDSLHGHTSRRQKYIESNPELHAKTKEYILAGQIVLGMTKSEVVASLGYPRDVNKSVGVWGVDEQWVYGSYTGTYLYFTNGILTSWQD